MEVMEIHQRKFQIRNKTLSIIDYSPAHGAMEDLLLKVEMVTILGQLPSQLNMFFQVIQIVLPIGPCVPPHFPLLINGLYKPPGHFVLIRGLSMNSSLEQFGFPTRYIHVLNWMNCVLPTI